VRTTPFTGSILVSKQGRAARWPNSERQAGSAGKIPTFPPVVGLAEHTHGPPAARFENAVVKSLKVWGQLGETSASEGADCSVGGARDYLKSLLFSLRATSPTTTIHKQGYLPSHNNK
jgi:hypothetical protein